MKGNIQCPRLIKGSLLDFVLETVDVFVNGSKNDCELVNFNYKEGKVVSRYSTKFERNSKLRKRAIDIYGKKTTHKIVIKVIVRKVINKMLQHKITTILM